MEQSSPLVVGLVAVAEDLFYGLKDDHEPSQLVHAVQVEERYLAVEFSVLHLFRGRGVLVLFHVLFFRAARVHDHDRRVLDRDTMMMMGAAGAVRACCCCGHGHTLVLCRLYSPGSLFLEGRTEGSLDKEGRQEDETCDDGGRPTSWDLVGKPDGGGEGDETAAAEFVGVVVDHTENDRDDDICFWRRERPP